jgi:hypothetical protein
MTMASNVIKLPLPTAEPHLATDEISIVRNALADARRLMAHKKKAERERGRRMHKVWMRSMRKLAPPCPVVTICRR